MRTDNSQTQRQPDPQPQGAATTVAPSLLLYLILTSIGVLLIVFAFWLDKADWPGLFINFGSGIITTVLLLIIIDQRIRASEIRAIQGFTEDAIIRVVSLFPGEIKTTVSYSAAIREQLRRIQPAFYVPRPELEEMLQRYPKGFFLAGLGGVGKSTLIQRIAIRQADEVIDNPKRAPIPLVIPARSYPDENIAKFLWSTANSYYPIKPKLFYSWLERGRISIFLDGLDEHPNPNHISTAVDELHRRYPNLTLVITSRHRASTDLSWLPYIQMAPMSEKEFRELISLLGANVKP